MQVCNLSWSKNVNEVVSTHGYSQNQIIVWKQPSMTKLATLTGHTMRVLYLAVSPDGQTIVTGAGAELPHPRNLTFINGCGLALGACCVWLLLYTDTTLSAMILPLEKTCVRNMQDVKYPDRTLLQYRRWSVLLEM